MTTATPNKLLDPSGKSVFCNLIGAAKGEWIRAAASTQPVRLLASRERRKQLVMRAVLLTAVVTLLLASAYASQKKNAFKPISSDVLIDVDGDGKPDRLFYEIRAWKTEYEGLIRITSTGDKILWEHQYLMMKHDLVNWLGVVGDISNTDWVQGFFANKYGYGAKAEHGKLKPVDFDDAQIVYAAKLAKTTPNKLREEILSQKENILFSYRAEWREDLMSLVYVPSLGRFICYHRGY
jgi:hypothetical protein